MTFSDKPDIVSITGRKIGDPTPPDPSKVTIFIVEHCYANAVTGGLVDAVRQKWIDYGPLTRILFLMGYNVILEASSTMFKRHEGVSSHDCQLFHDTQTAVGKILTNKSLLSPTGALASYTPRLTTIETMRPTYQSLQWISMAASQQTTSRFSIGLESRENSRMNSGKK